MDSKSPEREIFRKIEEANYDPHALNMPMSEEFLYNRRGNYLHVRTLWPADTEPSALVVFLHGYSSHANRPPIKYMSEQALGNSFAFVTIDFYGHGYSEGLKGYIQSEDDCVDDVLSLLLALYSDKNETEYFKFLRNASASLPFYLIGHSMGGAIGILLSNMLTNVVEPASHTEHSLTKVEDILRLSPNFRGSVLLCPAIEIPKPPPATIFVLANFLRPLFPEMPIPGLMGSSDDGQIFGDARYSQYVHADQQPENEKGLSWGGTVRFQTAYAILTMTERVIASLSHVSFPFLVMHDPQDAVCFYHGKLLHITFYSLGVLMTFFSISVVLQVLSG